MPIELTVRTVPGCPDAAGPGKRLAVALPGGRVFVTRRVIAAGGGGR